MSKENKTEAVKLNACNVRFNSTAAADCLAPDAMAVATGNSKFKGARSARMMIDGIEAFKSLIPGGLQLKVISAIADGDKVAVECEGNATTSTGTTYDNKYVFVCTLSEGKIVLVNEYFCTVLANEVLWPLAQSAAGLGETAG